MLIKNNLKQNFEKFLMKKLFSENLYQKLYIRKNFLDTNSILYNYKKNAEVGFSAFIKIFTYSHISNNKFTFNSFLNKKNYKAKYFLTNFHTTLVALKKKNKNFLLLKATKGGFYAYYSGIVGFIPFSSVLYFIQTIFLKFKTEQLFSIINIFRNLNKNLKCYRIYVKCIKLKLVLFSKRRNFVNVKKIKPHTYFFNSVFLLKKGVKTIISTY